jgi:hypothetical protein
MSNKSRYAVKRSLFRMPPGWKTYYQIGVAAQRRLPKHSTLDQVGRAVRAHPAERLHGERGRAREVFVPARARSRGGA